jgi:hypothetical protein
VAKSPEEQIREMLANLKTTTGKPLDGWLKIVTASKLEKHGEIVRMLKTDHGIGHGYANMIAHQARGSMERPSGSDADAATGQYDGPKAALRPIYDKLIEVIEGFGDDVELSPKKGYVSLRRSKQFATIHPSTATRVDVGIQLKGLEPKGRLEAAGSWNAMVSHRVRLSAAKEVDKELTAWLRAAYDKA